MADGQQGPDARDHGAEALTASYFEASRADVVDFLEHVAPHPRAQEAAQLLKNDHFKKVVANAWAGKETRFTRKLIGSGLAIYDVRLAMLFEDYAAWETAFKAIPKVFRRLTHMRGCATVGSQLIILASVGGTFLLMRSDNLRTVLGELIAVGAMGVIFDLLPGGFFASIVFDMESDETPRQRGIRKICESIDEYWDATDQEKATISAAVADMVDHPLDLPELPVADSGRIPVPPYTIPWWRQIPGLGNL